MQIERLTMGVLVRVCVVLLTVLSAFLAVAEDYAFFADIRTLYRCSRVGKDLMVKEWFDTKSQTDGLIGSPDEPVVYLFWDSHSKNGPNVCVSNIDAENKETVDTREIPGITRCSPHGISSDGSTIVLRTWFADTQKHNGCAPLSVHEMTLGTPFDAFGDICLLPNDRIVYRVRDKVGVLMSRNLSGNDERTEWVVPKSMYGRKDTKAFFLFSGKLHFVSAMDDRIEIYRIDSASGCELIWSHAGTYFAMSKDLHLFFRAANGTDLCCMQIASLTFGKTRVISDLRLPQIGLEQSEASGAYPNADGSTVFFVHDRGERERLDICSIDTIHGLWSGCASLPGGGITGEVVVIGPSLAKKR